MNQFSQGLCLSLVLLIACQAFATSEDNNVDQPSSLQLADDVSDDGYEATRFTEATDDARLARLQEKARLLRNWLVEASHSTGELDKRYRPSGFLGSRGKRYIPGLESLLLARYYRDAEKMKRQPHLGFHGSRG